MRNCILRSFVAVLVTGEDPDFVGPEANIILGAFFKKNTKLGTKVVTRVILNVRSSTCNYESNQQDANLQVNLLFLVGSTCFGRCFRLSSEALDCIYSF
jgi:hypothetical protein